MNVLTPTDTVVGVEVPSAPETEKLMFRVPMVTVCKIGTVGVKTPAMERVPLVVSSYFTELRTVW